MSESHYTDKNDYSKKLIENLIGCDEVKNFKTSLEKMMHEYMESEVACCHDDRRTILSHYRALNDLLEGAMKIENRKKTNLN